VLLVEGVTCPSTFIAISNVECPAMSIADLVGTASSSSTEAQPWRKRARLSLRRPATQVEGQRW
jgi:hypothetical protein